MMDLTEATLNETKTVLKNVKVCGCRSKNKREYPIEMLRKHKHLYEGVHVFVGHDLEAKNRSYKDRIGMIKNIIDKPDGLYGDFHINPKNTLYESVLFDFENNSQDIGLSHVVEGADMNDNVVRSFKKVRCVDLVVSPATCSTLREEVEEINEIDVLKKTLQETLNKVDELSKGQERLLTEICEMKEKRVESFNPLLEQPVSKEFDAKSWVEKLKRKF